MEKKINRLQADDLTYSEQIGQMLFLDACVHDSQEAIAQVEKYIKELHIGGLVFFHSRESAATSFEGNQDVPRYTDSYSRLKELIEHYQSLSRIPLMICIDAEYGLSMRIEESPQYPYASSLGCLGDDASQLTEEVGYRIGLDLKAAGIHMNFAPVVDVNSALDNPVIGYRSFGRSVDQVVSLSKAYIKGLEKAGILACIKHFPGHGDTLVDSHLGLPIIDKTREELENTELAPFRLICKEGVDSVMIGHLAVKSLSNSFNVPATLDPKIVTDILRKEWNYDGMIITDALNMHGITQIGLRPGEAEKQAFLAGNDILLVPTHPTEAYTSIAKTYEKEMVKEAADRILRAKNKIDQGIASNDPYDLKKSLKEASLLNKKIAAKSVIIKSEHPYLRKDYDYCIHYTDSTIQSNLLSKEIKKQFEDAVHINIDRNCLFPDLQTEGNILCCITLPQLKANLNYGLGNRFYDSLLFFLRTKGGNTDIVINGSPYFVDKLLESSAQPRSTFASPQSGEIWQMELWKNISPIKEKE
ncbi:MAG: glycoside hydrolase family 3 protein [Cyclobacteriaceae bacterium]|nr:glycoside hydrolase family 3 protein [Cyclobacteriaceae bacterium]MCH8515680.1 glycoside hydrolase family 3 protein [Cyclobacteriaceae bacterium]